MPSPANALQPDTLRTRDSATFTGSYQTLGSALSFPTRIMKVTNGSNVIVTISWDGTNDHEVVPANGFVLLDITANREISEICEIRKGTQFYVKGSASTGLVYLSTYYVAMRGL